MTKLSVIMPVFNEKDTIADIIRCVLASGVEKELVVVDDGSTDGTAAIIRELAAADASIRTVFHPVNSGKGSAIRSGIAAASGEAVIIQDADLEYDPGDYAALWDAFERNGRSKVIFGSRFLGKKKVTTPWHRAVNYSLTALTNALFGSRLTDMETCYKLFPSSLIRGLGLVSDGFEIEVELTAKTLLRGSPILEVPVSYRGRSFHEGKKIGWRDGIKAVRMLFHYRFNARPQ